MILATALLSITTLAGASDDHATTWYDASIQPFFDTYCTRCHGDNRQKGGLALHSHEALLMGSFEGDVFVAGDASASSLVQRMALDLDDEEHMPPKTKTQPSAAEVADLVAWIDAGADVRAAAPARASAAVPDAEPMPIDGPFPDELVATLLAEHVHIEIVDPVRRGVWVDFAARRDADSSSIARLAPLAPFIVDLGLEDTRITDAALPLIAEMPNLDRLDLARTAITSKGLEALAKHSALETLIVSGTAIDDSALATVASLPALTRLFTWKTSWTSAASDALTQKRSSVRVISATAPSSTALEVEAPPVFSRFVPLPAVNTACPVSGAPVDDTFRIVHEGEVIGVCCAECAAEFWANPAAYPVER